MDRPDETLPCVAAPIRAEGCPGLRGICVVRGVRRREQLARSGEGFGVGVRFVWRMEDQG